MVDQPRFRSRLDDDGDDWSDGRSERRSYRRPEPRFEQRLDQWMTAGRQLVDGVAGARPGSRPPARGAGAAAGPRLRPGDLGRWVENKIDWLLEDDDGWREPWQETRRPQPDVPAAPVPRRRPLEAVSLRGTPLLPQRPSSLNRPTPAEAAEAGEAVASDQDWPDDASFSVSRWRRDDAPVRMPRDSEPRSGSSAPTGRLPESPAPSAAPPPRAMPRSSRRRPG